MSTEFGEGDPIRGQIIEAIFSMIDGKIMIKEAAALLGVSRQMINSYRKHEKFPGPDVLHRAHGKLKAKLPAGWEKLFKQQEEQAQEVTTLSGNQLTLALPQEIHVREVFVNLESQHAAGNEIVLRITLGR